MHGKNTFVFIILSLRMLQNSACRYRSSFFRVHCVEVILAHACLLPGDYVVGTFPYLSSVLFNSIFRMIQRKEYRPIGRSIVKTNMGYSQLKKEQVRTGRFTYTCYSTYSPCTSAAFRSCFDCIVFPAARQLPILDLYLIVCPDDFDRKECFDAATPIVCAVTVWRL